MGRTEAPISATLRQSCVYCLDNGHIEARQVLFRASHVYLCAPRGQILEGFLAIAPYECIGCLSRMPADYLQEIVEVKRTVAHFYEAAYGCERATFYEQGRAGGGAAIDAVGGFPHHAHLCALPLALDLHSGLEKKYAQKSLSALDELPEIAGCNPYLYVEGVNRFGDEAKALYLSRSHQERAELERYRLKPTIAALIGHPDRGHWNAYPGDRELECLIQRFAVFSAAID